MFVGKYNYTQASAKCAEEGGIIAMATDTNTFNILFNILNEHWNAYRTDASVHLDGSQGVMNPQFSGWFCMNTGGPCPATMPWHPGQPSDPAEKCAGMMVFMKKGVRDGNCSDQCMTMCKFEM